MKKQKEQEQKRKRRRKENIKSSIRGGLSHCGGEKKDNETREAKR